MKILKKLSERDANVSAVDDGGFTPLHHASTGQVAGVEIPLQYNADITARNKFGETPLLTALSNPRSGVYYTNSPGQLLNPLQFEGSQRLRNSQGQNALHVACDNIREETGSLKRL